MSTSVGGREALPQDRATLLPTSNDTQEPQHISSDTPTVDMSMDPATWENDATIVKATKTQDATSLATLSCTGPSTTTFSLDASPLPTKSSEPRLSSAATPSVTSTTPATPEPSARAHEPAASTPPESAGAQRTMASHDKADTQATKPSSPAEGQPSTDEGAVKCSQKADPPASAPSQPVLETRKDEEPASHTPSAREEESDREESEDSDTPDEEPTDDGTEERQEAAEEDTAEAESSQSQPPQTRKRPRSPSPFDPYTSQPPPRPTLRLQFPLTHAPRHKSDYIFRIPRLAVDQLSDAYPEWTSWYRAMYLEGDMAKTSREVGLSAEELHDLGGLAKLLHKYPTQGPATHLSRKRRIDEYDVGSYDTKDPFVDDSELGVDEPTHVVRTRADGFYVVKGPVALACAKASTMESSRSASAFRSSLGAGVGQGWAAGTNKLLAKRAASRKLQQSNQATPSDSTATTPSDTSTAKPPAPASDSSSSGAADPAPATTAAASTTTEHGTPANAAPMEKADTKKLTAREKRKNKYPTVPVHPQLQAMFDHLKQLVSKASFAVKTKFPPELKPPLIETAKLAVELDEYNDNFFNYLPSIFPYNRFTMMKLTKREFFHKHMEYFRELQEEHLDRLGKMIDESFPTQLADYEAMCRERGVEGKDNEEGGMDEDGETAADDARLQIEPDDMTKRFRWSDEMRDELFTIVTVENAMSEIRNEKL